MNKTKFLILLLVVSCLFNIVCLQKIMRSADRDEINNDSKPIEHKKLDLEFVYEAYAVALLQNTNYLSDDADSYLALVDENGKISDIYNLDNHYETLGYDKEKNEIILVSKKEIVFLNEKYEKIEKEIEGDFCDISLIFEKDRIYISSRYFPEKDERVEYTNSYGYTGYITTEIPLSYLPTAIILLG